MMLQYHFHHIGTVDLNSRFWLYAPGVFHGVRKGQELRECVS